MNILHQLYRTKKAEIGKRYSSNGAIKSKCSATMLPRCLTIRSDVFDLVKFFNKRYGGSPGLVVMEEANVLKVVSLNPSTVY